MIFRIKKRTKKRAGNRAGNRTRNRLALALLLASWGGTLHSQTVRFPYQDPALSVELRTGDLLSRMTPEEKFWQLFMISGLSPDETGKCVSGLFGLQMSDAGYPSLPDGEEHPDPGIWARDMTSRINEVQRFFVEKTRLGIPVIPFDEALHGLARKGATAFPQAIGLAATWDTDLMARVAGAIAVETATRGVRQVLSPVINIARDVRWGRVEETYGEDPFLTAQMALAFVREFEKRGVVTTPKHFAANVGDGGRDSYPIHASERLLEEIYFPAFKACVQQGGSRSVMTAYNSLDGRPCSANGWLLQKKLKEEWGFMGFVISDAGAVGGIRDLHKTAAEYREAAEQAVGNGLDVIFLSSFEHSPLFNEAFRNGKIRQERIDEAVERVLRVKFALGLFDRPYADEGLALQWNGHPDHKKLAKQAALESIVLLKNENRVLPVTSMIRSVAVIGQDAVEHRLGGYSGPGNRPVSILEGIEEKCGGYIRIDYARGCGRVSAEYPTISPEYLSHDEDGKQAAGLKGEYFNTIHPGDRAGVIRIDPEIRFQWTLFPPAPGINPDFYSVRWTGKIRSPRTGPMKIGLEGKDGYRLYIDQKRVIDNWKKQGFQTIVADYPFVKDREYDIRIEYFETTGNGRIRLVWNAGPGDSWEKDLKNALMTVKKCDMAIIVAGIEEGEFRDRAFLSLPGHQEEMIRKIADAGKPLVVVLVGGSAVTMNSWGGLAHGILAVWYPGEEGGHAVADVLFGDYTPAGRLPITFPVHESQLPLYYNHQPTGRGDDYLNLTGEPQFPFGFGLSYTEFEYDSLCIHKASPASCDSLDISFRLRNTGGMAGDEVVQLYIQDRVASVTRPVMELRGFRRVTLGKGEEKEVRFMLPHDAFSMLNVQNQRIVEPGTFTIMIGGSSKDIRLREIITIE